jgi:[FeFe] hydrogenase H-cluster maturation GTPase HydF
MDKLHIGIYGAVNSGKSTIINKLAGQEIAIVSPIAGTTTDPVRKLMELDGIGPVVLIDTAGNNDVTELGRDRVAKSLQSIDIVDLAVLVVNNKLEAEDEALVEIFKTKNKPFFIINNKSDLPDFKPFKHKGAEVLAFSKNAEVQPALDLIKKYRPALGQGVLLDGIIKKDDVVALVIPIDSAAPIGRIILPQVNVLRNILDLNAIAVSLQTGQLAGYLKSNPKPRLVITDSQAFKEVSEIVPKDIALTSFSILFSRLKGNFEESLTGARKISNLKDGEKVLILESCSHSAITCEDIGRIKLPNLIRKKSGKELSFTIIPSLEKLPEDLSSYALAVQCGGCMATKNQLSARLGNVKNAGVSFTNYGIAIAYCTGILDRVIEIFAK